MFISLRSSKMSKLSKIEIEEYKKEHSKLGVL